ncbi:MAG: phosphoenolpyruvate--protein phosphotransferase [Caldilineaceae bacterium]
MIGIVIVSHSPQLAAGVRELALQMVHEHVPIALAAGIDDPVDPIGTDPLRVAAAIQSVYSEDGVLVLMDLGSALLSAETALEFLEPAQQKHVFLCEAPLVEGAVAAAVQAMTGSSMDQVLAEARGALAAKAQQLSPLWQTATEKEERESSREAGDSNLAAAQTLVIVVPNALGLHMRPLARLVEIVSQFAAEVYITKDGKTANVRSINHIAALGTHQGDELIFHAIGEEAGAVLAAIQALAHANFGERDHREPASSAAAKTLTLPKANITGEVVGIPASAGIAIGPVALYRPNLPVVVERFVHDSKAEWAKFEQAIQAALTELHQVAAQTQQTDLGEAMIFAAHRLMLQDPELEADVRHQIFVEQRNAEAAWQRAIHTVVKNYQALDDAYLRQRATDAFDVGQRVLRHLLNAPLPALDFQDPVILVTRELTPSEAAQLDPEQILGIIMAAGGITGHSIILARAFGIPALIGVGDAINRFYDDQLIAFDGATGQIWEQPTSAELAALREQARQRQAAHALARQSSQLAALTQDNQRIKVAANISSLNDIEQALELGAEGVGLFRTEFLFMGREQAPDEDEQWTAYKVAANKLGTRPLIIRTLDAGGDKPIPYLKIGVEANAFLGWRGIRYCLDHPEIFKPQLRAILRASVHRNVKLLFPMVSTVEEVRCAKALIYTVQEELRAAQIPFDEDMEIGIMIEVPSAVMQAAQLAREVDFFSIGTNDLTQYLLAADRGNAQVAGLVNALQPAVLHAIQQVVQAAHSAGIGVGLCGELASHVAALPLLLGLGLTELSMNAAVIPQVKARIRELNVAQAQMLVAECLALSSAAEVEERLTQYP